MTALAIAPSETSETRAQISAFLHAMFADKPQPLYLLIWTLPDKRSAWFNDVAQAAKYVWQAEQARKDVYLGVSLSHLDRGPNQRGDAKDSAGIVGLWADMDVGNHGSRKVYPPNQEAALSILAGLPAPTLVVHSGHGLHLWWLFKEPWVFESTPECKDAMILAKRWTMTIQAKGQGKGWDVDSTGDLARVLRVPGTTNRKDPSNPTPVVILSDDGPRYNPSDFEEYLVDVDPGELFDETIREGLTFVLDPRANPPVEKLRALLENDSKFKKTWERKRQDLQDPSASGYDMALADAAALAGWTGQEIINLIIAWRRKHEEKIELRPSKYTGALDKARKHAARWKAPEWEPPSDPESEAEAQAVARSTTPIQWLQEHPVFKRVPIVGARKLGRKRGQYELILRGGVTVELGTAEDVLTPRKVQAAIGDAIAVAIQELKRDKWRDIAEAIFLAAGPGEDIGTDPETEARSWLAALTNDYLFGSKLQTVDTSNAKELAERMQMLRMTSNSFSQDGHHFGWFWTAEHELCVHIPTLVRFVTGPFYGARTTQADARLRLRRLGFRPVQFSARAEDGIVAKGRLWISPKGFDPDE